MQTISNKSNSNISNSNISNISNNQLLYPSEAGRLLKVSLQTLRRWHRDGTLSAVITPGHQMRIPKSEVERILGRYAPVDRPIPQDAYKGFEEEKTGIHSTPAPAVPETSFLASLFKTSSDPIDAQAEQDVRFGYVPRNTNKSASFTI